jgi:hypothetical protein
MNNALQPGGDDDDFDPDETYRELLREREILARFLSENPHDTKMKGQLKRLIREIGKFAKAHRDSDTYWAGPKAVA